jgi:Bacteriophage tail sheath protein
VAQYLAPGVYVEEVSFTAPTIEGVSTTTTGFVGPTLTGPVCGMPYGGLPASGSPVAGAAAPTVPQLLTSFGDFQNIYGGYDSLNMTLANPQNPARDINYMAMAVQEFFLNGGSELYVSRVYANNPGSTTGTIDPGISTSGTASATNVVVAGRFPGAFLNGQQVTVTLTASRVMNFNLTLQNPNPGMLLGTPGTAGGTATFYSNGTGTTFTSNASTPVTLSAATFPSSLYVLTVQVTAPAANGTQMVFNSLGLDPNNVNYIADVLGLNPPRPIDALQNQVWFNIGSTLNTAIALFNALFPFWVDPAAAAPAWKSNTAYTANQLVTDSNGNVQAVTTAGTSGAAAPTWNTTIGQSTTDSGVTWKNLGPAVAVATFTFGADAPAWKPNTAYTANQLVTDSNGNVQAVTTAGTSGAAAPTWNTTVGQSTTDGGVTWKDLGPAITFGTNGDDGAEPMATNYTTPFQYLAALEDIAIVATPGSSIYADATDIMTNAVIPHVSAQRAYRVAILEAGPGLLDSDYQTVRGQVDSSYAGLYVPWVWTANPLAVAGTSTPAQILVPPSGFMAGIYARSDVEYSVAKAPANEPVLGASDFERHINFAEQQLLNPLGINCLRYFPDRGYLVWGARTVSSDTEVMYINVRRYLIYLEHSIDAGTQWAVFQNNGPILWARLSDSIDSFLNNEFHEGNLLGSSPSQAYFVRCDRTTMTQNDLDNGKMICVIGVALLKPAEFVIFRIGQMTASAQS